MEETISPLGAKRLREAFKNTTEVGEKAPKIPIGDHMKIICYAGNRDRFIAIYKDGELVAQAPISNPIFKRLKREWIMWNDLKSGAIREHMLYGKIVSKPC